MGVHDVAMAVGVLLSRRDLRSVTRFVGKGFKVTASRHGKKLARERRDTVVVTVGPLNFAERAHKKRNPRATEWLRPWPVKRQKARKPKKSNRRRR